MKWETKKMKMEHILDFRNMNRFQTLQVLSCLPMVQLLNSSATNQVKQQLMTMLRI